MKFLDTTIPKLNGRPQMWIETWGYKQNLERIRIIYPDGRVEFMTLGVDADCLMFLRGCTSAHDQLSAIKLTVQYFYGNFGSSQRSIDFLGYL